MLEFHIEQASNLLTEDGTPFGDDYHAEKVIEAARAFHRQSEGQPKTQIPCDEIIARREDMGAGRLQLIRQEDGDMCLAVIDDEGNMSGIEFCTSVVGGGRSPKVLAALYALAEAIIEDNQERPLPL